MSKADKALQIYLKNQTKTRGEVMELIIEALEVSAAYASTLYAGAKKASWSPTTKPTATKKPKRSGRIEKFTPSICKQIDNDVVDALKSVEAKWGIKFNVGGGTYSDDTFTTKLKIALAGVDVAKKEWDRYCYRFGLKPEDYGSMFESRGTTFKVVGLKPKSRRYPIIGENDNGMRYKFPATILGGEYDEITTGDDWF